MDFVRFSGTQRFPPACHGSLAVLRVDNLLPVSEGLLRMQPCIFEQAVIVVHIVSVAVADPDEVRDAIGRGVVLAFRATHPAISVPPRRSQPTNDQGLPKEHGNSLGSADAMLGPKPANHAIINSGRKNRKNGIAGPPHTSFSRLSPTVMIITAREMA